MTSDQKGWRPRRPIRAALLLFVGLSLLFVVVTLLVRDLAVATWKFLLGGVVYSAVLAFTATGLLLARAGDDSKFTTRIACLAVVASVGVPLALWLAGLFPGIGFALVGCALKAALAVVVASLAILACRAVKGWRDALGERRNGSSGEG